MTIGPLALGLALCSQAPELVPPGAKPEKLWGEGEFTEGGAMAPDGSILFSDIGNRIMRFDPKAGATAAYRDPGGRSNGMIFDPKGRLIVAEGANTGGNRRVSVTEPGGAVRTLADSFEGKRFNSPNDVAIDAEGNVYVSDPRYVGDEPRELDFEGVFRITPAGKVTRVATSAKKPNGLVVGPDGTLYIADNGARKALLACKLAPSGEVTLETVLAEFGPRGGIDGMTITDDGRIVATGGHDRNAVTVFGPDGKVLGTIAVPESPANVEFGGEGNSTLYIMAGVSLYRIETSMKGFRPAMPPKE